MDINYPKVLQPAQYTFEFDFNCTMFDAKGFETSRM